MEIRLSKKIALTIIISILIYPVASEKIILYETDFSKNPHWTTNTPLSLYWDEDNENYHYIIKGSTAAYSYKTVFYRDTTFMLEYDVTPLIVDPNGAMRFGLSDDNMDIYAPMIVYSELGNKKGYNLFYLTAIGQLGNRFNINSYYESYGGSTVTYETGKTYHMIIKYNREEKTLTEAVRDVDSNKVLWSISRDVADTYPRLDRICFTAVGDYLSNNYAEGYIDDVKLTIWTSPRSLEEISESRATPEHTATIAPEESPTSPLATLIPVAVPTASLAQSSSCGCAITFIGIVACFFLMSAILKRR